MLTKNKNDYEHPDTTLQPGLEASVVYALTILLTFLVGFTSLIFFTGSNLVFIMSPPFLEMCKHGFAHVVSQYIEANRKKHVI